MSRKYPKLPQAVLRALAARTGPMTPELIYDWLETAEEPYPLDEIRLALPDLEKLDYVVSAENPMTGETGWRATASGRLRGKIA